MSKNHPVASCSRVGLFIGSKNALCRGTGRFVVSLDGRLFIELSGNIYCVENFMSLVAVGLAEVLLINPLYVGIFV